MKPIIIIGAGLTGLSCAYHLEKAGLDYRIYEKEPEVGGRLRTENIDGFTIDRGFQVYLTAYPEGEKILDYGALKLHNFDPGALILQENGKIDEAYDPLRMPSKFMKSMKADIGTWGDKLKILSLRSSILKDRFEKMFDKDRKSTIKFLRSFGFSRMMIEKFFKPFYGGIFLEDDLETNANMFRFIYRMFSLGHAALPEGGMHEIPLQIASFLDPSKIITGAQVTGIDNNTIEIVGGNAIEFDHCVIATEGHTATKLSGNSRLNDKYVSSSQFYFSSEEKPYQDKLIALNSSKSRIANNVCVLNNIVEAYAQKGNLISCTVLNDKSNEVDDKKVLSELSKWFPNAEKWDLIKRIHIAYSLPDQTKVSYTKEPIIKGNLVIGGDHLQNGSINNALKMGEDISKILNNKYS
jgi:protoporphyrinogen oxidase